MNQETAIATHVFVDSPSQQWPHRAWEKTALITGASGGIGLELAKVFARSGHDLALVARIGQHLGEEKINLTHQFGVEVSTFQHDLSLAGAPVDIKYGL